MAKQCQTQWSQRRQREMKDGLLRLMHGCAYEDITVTDICREAGIPRRSFYHYFDSKDDILDSVIEDLVLACNLDAMFDFASGPEAVKQSNVRFFRFWREENLETLELLLANSLEPRLVDTTLKWIHREGVGLPRPAGFTPGMVEMSSTMLSTGFFALLFHWVRSGCREAPEEMGELVTWFLSNSIF